MKLRYFIFILILIFIIGCAQQQIETEQPEKQIEKTYGVSNMKLTSSAFENGGDINIG